MKRSITVTSAKLEANRRNGQKSTGPKTQNGKAVSKMNATKHGLLAQSVVVRGHKIRESSREFRKLCGKFFDSLAPVGPLEEMLVNQIVTVTWRLRRACKAESGEIALSVDGGCARRENHNPLTMILNMPQTPFADPLLTQLERSALGCHYLLFLLRDLRKDMERDSELTEAAVNDLKTALRDHPNPMVTKLDGFRLWLVANPEKMDPDALRSRHKEDVLNYLDGQIRNIEYMEERRDEQEKAEEESRQAAAVLPSEATLDKILRYEAALERQLYRAINQLERLQRRRQGENIPAPLTMEVSTRA